MRHAVVYKTVKQKSHGNYMLIKETEEFFNRHWSSNKPAPEWCFGWEWKGPVPNHLFAGLYALFKDDLLVYIGLGRSGSERGISARLESHVLKISRDNNDYRYIPQKKWSDLGVNKLATIGFPSEFSYLSPALEDFLIAKLKPPANHVGK